LKILLINSVCGIGSTGRICTDIYQALEKEGHKCTIAYSRGNPKGFDTIKIGNKWDVRFHALRSRITDRQGFYSKQATKKFVKVIKERQFDIIHLHNIHGYYLNLKILFEALKNLEAKVVWTFHDCWPFTGHCPHFEFVGCNKWLEKCYKCPQKSRYPKSIFLDNSTRNYLEKKRLFTSLTNITIITPSKWLEGLVRKSFFKEYPIYTINNGINLDIFKKRNSDLRIKEKLGDKFIVLGVTGVWDERKGLNVFIELSKLLDESYKIILVGLTEQQKKHLPNNIIGIIRTENIERLAEIYSASDVFLNPTFEDTFPTTNLEALACGTPVVTFNSGGSPEIINSQCGMIVDVKNAETLKEILENLKNSNFETELCIQKSKNYGIISMVNNYLAIYREL